MATLIDGKARAAALRETVATGARELLERTGVRPGLTVVIVGEDPASQVYVRNKGRMAEAAGFVSETHRLPAGVPQAELLALIDRLNADDAVHGILVQLPLPDHIDDRTVINRIDPDKDVDGFHTINVGRLSLGLDGFVPCTPLGCVDLIESTGTPLAGQHAVIVGRSNIVGKPMAALLLARHCTVTIAHSRTRHLAALCRQADILVAAVGRPKLVAGDWVKDGATVIDVGINRVPADDGKSRLVGDVDFDAAAERAAWITPVPGGVGPMTIACLLSNTLKAARRATGRASQD